MDLREFDRSKLETVSTIQESHGNTVILVLLESTRKILPVKTFAFRLSVVLVSLLIGSCRSSVQVVKMSPKTSIVKDGQTHFAFDNDTVRIAYHFWGERGTFWFEIQNKLKKPIYIDWKRSNLLNNNIPYAYWNDDKEVSTISVSKGSGAAVSSNGIAVAAASGAALSKSIITSKERIGFLSPNATLTSPQFRIANEYFILSKDADRKEVLHDAKNKTTPIFSQTFTDDSPIKITNFLTLSLSESFDEDIFVENSFFASEISEMEKSHFLGKVVGYETDSKPIYQPSSYSEKSFYMMVPKDYNHRSYWKVN